MTSLYQQDRIRFEGQLMKLFFWVVILLTVAVGELQTVIENDYELKLK